MSTLVQGQEYNIEEIDFLSKLPFVSMTATYLGVHPYDKRHIFACKDGGCVFVPEDGVMLNKLKPTQEPKC